MLPCWWTGRSGGRSPVASFVIEFGGYANGMLQHGLARADAYPLSSEQFVAALPLTAAVSLLKHHFAAAQWVCVGGAASAKVAAVVFDDAGCSVTIAAAKPICVCFKAPPSPQGHSNRSTVYSNQSQVSCSVKSVLRVCEVCRRKKTHHRRNSGAF